jgi:D-alanyl-D-alanine carboxypeptidase (penicillin-binding protein 5/6)
VQNRHLILWLYPGAIGVKTGFTTAAGYCVVAAAARDGLRLVAVVLGASGEPFSDAATLLDYGFTAFHRVELVAKEEPLGDVEIQGRSVEVASGDALDALVPVDAEVRRRLVVRPGAAFPPPVGESVGGLVVTTSDARVGRVPLIVTSVPGPPPPDPGPWWRRAGATVVHAVSVVVRSLFS